MGNRLSLEAKTENLQEVQRFLDAMLEEGGFLCDPRQRMRLEVAVEEIFVNVAHYAYAPGTGVVEIEADWTEDREGKREGIQITFTDGGIPFNPLAKADPDVTASAKDRPIGGLGILMVKKSTEAAAYDYRDGKNIFAITKVLRASG